VLLLPLLTPRRGRGGVAHCVGAAQGEACKRPQRLEQLPGPLARRGQLRCGSARGRSLAAGGRVGGGRGRRQLGSQLFKV
jgi:hypothetical protein